MFLLQTTDGESNSDDLECHWRSFRYCNFSYFIHL